MKIDRITLLFLALLASGSVLILFSILDQRVRPPRVVKGQLGINFNHGYQVQVRRIFQDYLAERIKLEDLPTASKTAEWLKLLEKIKEDLSRLRTGSQYQTERLAIIRQIEKMRQSLTEGRPEKIKAEETELVRVFNKI